MSRRRIGVALAALMAIGVAAAPAEAGSRHLNAYRVKASATNLEKLAMAGFDVTEGRRIHGKVEIYGTARQVGRFAAKAKVKARLVRDRKGRSAARRSVAKVRAGQRELGLAGRRSLSAYSPTANASDAAYKVWSKYDAVPGDGKEQYTEYYDRIANRYSGIAKKVVIGTTEWGRQIIAIQVTQGATGNDNGRPAVLYNSMQHAREWLAGETCRRTLDYFVRNYGKDARVTRLVNTRQLWFSCVSNPDGYEYTFTPGNRLWRKNLHNNDGDPTITNVDGVDPNRNFPVNWGLDNEGSSDDLASETYRGTGPASEPETQAMLALWDRVDFAFQKNDHTAAQLILYPQGWQQYTPAADDPIYTALAGDDAHPAIETFDPDLGAELYITNGDTLDTAYNSKGILAYTPEGSEPNDKDVSGFEYEDVEGQIDNEFRRHLAFSFDLAESADDPANPDSHLGNTVQDFYIDPFQYSYGDPQTVQVLAKDELGPLQMHVKVNGQERPAVDAAVWNDGQRYYQEAGVYYHRYRAQVTNTSVGDSVEVWFAQAGGAKRSASFTYTAVADSTAPVLIMAAEDYSGPTPADADGAPNYLAAYRQALEANGVPYEIYDVDARGRKAPHPLGVLSHFDAVVWYTGDDYLTREPGQVPGTGTSRLALEEMLATRDYLNEGGKLMLAGKNAGQQYFEGYEFRNQGFPQPNEDKHGIWCDPVFEEPKDGCITHTDDFFQYYLGAYLRVEDGGSWANADPPAAGEVQPVQGVGVFSGLWDPAPTAGDASAGAPTSTLVSTSSLLHTDAYDDFSEVVGAWDRGGEAGPFSPHSPSHYLYSGTDDEAYKRLHQTVTVPQTGDATLKFWVSFDIEQDWDFFFVEAAPTGSDNWTTLPDSGPGHYTSTATGDSCWEDAGWGAELHDRLLHYQTKKGDSCTPSGTTGTWNAGTGSSNGWQQWTIDLSAYRGQEIELAMVYASDWAVQNLGVWLDDIQLFGGPVLDFEGAADTWERGSLASSPNQATWPAEPSTQSFDEGAVIGTKDVQFQDGTTFTTNPAVHDSVYAGFELGTVPDPAQRASFMREVMEYFGVLAEDD